MIDRPSPQDTSTGGGRSATVTAVERSCANWDCETRLSRYNSGTYCSLHEPRTSPRIRAKKGVPSDSGQRA